MYALITGKPPFAASTLAKVLSDLRNTEPIPLSRQVPQVPPEFDDIVMQLLQKEPEKRMATALVLANQLRAMEHAINRKATLDQEPAPESSQTKLSTQTDGQPQPVQADSDSDDTRSLRPTVEAPQFAPKAQAVSLTKTLISALCIMHLETLSWILGTCGGRLPD